MTPDPWQPHPFDDDGGAVDLTRPRCRVCGHPKSNRRMHPKAKRAPAMAVSPDVLEAMAEHRRRIGDRDDEVA